MTKSHATVNDWKAVYRTAYNGVLVGDMCRSLPSSINIFRRVSSRVNDIRVDILKSFLFL